LPGAKIIILGVSFLALLATAQKEQTSDAKYITGALSTAPTAIAKGAAVVRFEGDGSMRTLREDGVRKVLSGLTSADEVISVTIADVN